MSDPVTVVPRQKKSMCSCKSSICNLELYQVGTNSLQHFLKETSFHGATPFVVHFFGFALLPNLLLMRPHRY